MVDLKVPNLVCIPAEDGVLPTCCLTGGRGLDSPTSFLRLKVAQEATQRQVTISLQG